MSALQTLLTPAPERKTQASLTPSQGPRTSLGSRRKIQAKRRFPAICGVFVLF